MISFFTRQIRGPLVLILAIASLAYGFFILEILPFWADMKAAGGGRELQETLFFSAERAGAALSAYDAATRRGAFGFYALDVLNAILFAASIAALMAYALRRLRVEEKFWRWAIVLPLASGLCDLIENGLLTLALLNNPAHPGWLGTLAGIFTGLKLTTGLAAIAIMLLMLIAAGGLYTWRQLNPPEP